MQDDVVCTLRKLWRQTQVAAGVSVPVSRGMASELCELAVTRDVKMDRSVSSRLCRQCSTLLLPGLNCTVRVVNCKRRKQRPEGNHRGVTVLRIHCHACDGTTERLGRARRAMRRDRSSCSERLEREERAASKQRAREEADGVGLGSASPAAAGDWRSGSKTLGSKTKRGRAKDAVQGARAAKGTATKGNRGSTTAAEHKKTATKKKKGKNASLQKLLSQARQKQGAQQEDDYSLGSFLKSL